MKFHQLKNEVCREVKESLERVDEKEVQLLLESILSAQKVFVVGAGRVMLIMRSFAKRMKHLGIDVHVVGETVEPPIGGKDLLLAGSASGETMITVTIARIARSRGARIGLITSSTQSKLRQLANICVRIPCPTKLHLSDEPRSFQPMGNLFEQSLLVFGDCLAVLLQDRLRVTEEQMWKAHANLE